MSIESVTEWLTLQQAADLLGVSSGRVSRLVEEHQLIAVRRDREFMIPAHLIQNGEPLPSIRGTIVLLLDSGLTLEAAVNWIYSESAELGATPISQLLLGHKAPVRRAAQMFAL